MKLFIQSNMYFFDLWVLINTILFILNQHVFHTDITTIIDDVFEYWHFNYWDFSIWTCSTDFIKYDDESFIFFSDCVQYRCIDENCFKIHQFYYEQIIFFDRDQRMGFNTIKKTLLKLWKLLNSMNVTFYFILKFYHWSTNKLLLIENQNQYIQSKQIHNHVLNIQFCKQDKFIDFSSLHVHQVFNLFKNQFRVIDLLLFIQDELKLQQYDCEYLISQLITNI